MIVILCKNVWDAANAFNLFKNLLINNGDCITRVWDACNCVETDSDLKYIFIDYRMEPFFENIGADIMDEDEFLFGVEEMYNIVEYGRF